EMIGLGQISLNTVGWATGLADFDNDGFLDLWVVNGNTLELAADSTKLKPQRIQVFRQKPSAGFFEVGQQASPSLIEPVVGRGGAHADYDGDGKLDIAIMIHSGQPILLHNVAESDHHWLVLRLRQHGGNTYALGARVALQTGEQFQYAQIGTGGSYLSQHHSDMHFGLGDATTTVDSLKICWPDGHFEQYEQIDVDQVLTLTHAADYNRTPQPCSLF
ncbi:MAG: CRTAC1 family protein, partial [Gammaproteobacteria bacterium]|nr:CRTAC1 family protein [Gammaproteobacteria bacterium]